MKDTSKTDESHETRQNRRQSTYTVNTIVQYTQFLMRATRQGSEAVRLAHGWYWYADVPLKYGWLSLQR